MTSSLSKAPSHAHVFAVYARTSLSPRCIVLRSRQPQLSQHSRLLSIQSRSQSTLTATHDADAHSTTTQPVKTTLKIDEMKGPPPLAIVPFSHLLRTLMITSITTSPALSNALTSLLARYATFLSTNALTSRVLKATFYDHFCAGNSKSEIADTVVRLKSWGFKGACLNYAKEVEKSDKPVSKEQAEEELKGWMEGTIKTVEYSAAGDYIAIKFSGAGKAVVDILAANPSSLPTNLTTAVTKICQIGHDRNVALLFDAEHAAIQPAIDAYVLRLMKEYNAIDKQPLVYNTYQMYLKNSPKVLAAHLKAAEKEGFALGAKVVRGAYLHTDPRELIHDKKADTDACYNNAVSMLLQAPERVGLVVASHNRESVENARELLVEGKKSGKGEKTVAFAQLMGMADEISLDLVAKGGEEVNVVKYLPWGTIEECVKYLLRRADENKDALQRTVDSRNAVWKEIWRRGILRAE